MSIRFRSPNRNIAKFLGRTEETNITDAPLATIGLIGGGGSGSGTVSAYETLDSLPVSDLSAGNQAFISENNRLYVSNGSGWYNIALINAAPYWDSSPLSEYTKSDSATPLIITAKALDSDNPNTILSNLSFASDSAQYLVNITTDSSVFTFTPKSQDSIGAFVTAGDLTDSNTNSFSYTFKWSDGINFISSVSSFTYNFATDAVFTPTNAYSYLNTNRADAATVTTNNVDTWVLAGGGRWSSFRTGNLLNVPGYNSGDTFWTVIEFTSMGLGFSTRSMGGWTFYSDAAMTTGLDGIYDPSMQVRSDTMDVVNENNGTNDREGTYTPPGATSDFVMAMYFDGDKSAQYWVSTNSGSTWLGPVQTHTWSAAPAAIAMYCQRRDDDGSPQSMILRDPGNYTLPTATI